MPKKKVQERGGAKRHVTVPAGKDKYMRCDVTEEPGPRGGHVVCGKPKKRKAKK